MVFRKEEDTMFFSRTVSEVPKFQRSRVMR